MGRGEGYAAPLERAHRMEYPISAMGPLPPRRARRGDAPCRRLRRIAELCPPPSPSCQDDGVRHALRRSPHLSFRRRAVAAAARLLLRAARR
ncbi:hypothetical protein AB1Y20_003255 [Prymnesium parvum]|uniref:Uncharacterized protein n=1 Tax=Prymnesium parvum TaxID=97485 RepID=A0AB34JDR3_PRYPA